jgi:hypothetical protein
MKVLSVLLEAKVEENPAVVITATICGAVMFLGLMWLFSRD